jgi:hypothetical protein
LRFSLFSGLVKGRSVPASRRTLYWAGESCFFHSAGVFSISNFSVVFSPALALLGQASGRPRKRRRSSRMQAGYGGRSWSKLRAHRKIDCPSRSTVPAAKSYSISSGLLTFTRAHGRRGHLTAITPANRRYSRSGARPAPVVVHGRRRMLPRNRSLRLAEASRASLAYSRASSRSRARSRNRDSAPAAAEWPRDQMSIACPATRPAAPRPKPVQMEKTAASDRRRQECCAPEAGRP